MSANKYSSPFDALYRRDEIDSALAPKAPRELRTGAVRAVRSNGFLTAAGLRRITRSVHLALRTCTPNRVAELGCGAGGLSRYLAERFRCKVVGVDESAVAVALARSAASRMGVGCSLAYRRADFALTGLPSSAFAAVVSLDALYLAPSPLAALVEARRLLAPGGALWFSAYVASSEFPGAAPLQDDFRPILRQAGLAIVSHTDVSSEWRAIMRAKHWRRWSARDSIRAAIGPRAELELAVSAAMLGLYGGRSFLKHATRIEVVAQRQ